MSDCGDGDECTTESCSAGRCEYTDAEECACTPTTEVCGDGSDNDCDGNTDCDDANCSAAPGLRGPGRGLRRLHRQRPRRPRRLRGRRLLRRGDAARPAEDDAQDEGGAHARQRHAHQGPQRERRPRRLRPDAPGHDAPGLGRVGSALLHHRRGEELEEEGQEGVPVQGQEEGRSPVASRRAGSR